MRRFKGADLAQTSGGNPRAKIAVMVAGLLVLGGALIWYQSSVRRKAPEPVTELPEVAYRLEVPRVPEGTFDGVADATREDRVVLERSELEVTKAVARQLLPAHFEELEALQLDPSTLERLAGDPAANRGELLTVRGRIEEIRSRTDSPGRVSDWFGRLRTTEGVDAYFVALQQPERTADVGDWVRLDGLFFKRFAEEDLATGQWIEAPLVVAPRIQHSFEDFGTVDDFAMELPLITGLTDDTFESTTEMPELVEWRVLALMRDLPEDGIDWATAPELDGPTMVAITRDGEPFRGQPFVLPVSKMQGMKVLRTGENPAGLTHRTEAWIANQNWTKHEPLLHVIAPGQREQLGVGELVRGRLVYLRNMAYTTAENTRRIVPVFAGYELERFEPVESPLLGYIVTAFLSLTAVLAGFIVVMVQRDQRRSREMQRKLIERKRARRERDLAQSGAS